MRLLLLQFLLTCQIVYCQKPENGFVLMGRSINADSLRQATLINTASGDQETVNVTNGKFVFTGRVDYPCLALVTANNLNPGIGVWLCNDTIQVDFKVAKQENGNYLLQTEQVRGPQDAVDYLYHFKIFLPLYRQKLNQQISDKIRDYVELHPNSYYSVHLISTYINEIGASASKELLAFISPKAKQSKEAVYLAQRIETLEKNALGTSIKDFSLPDSKNQIRKLSMLAKPYTLIHFWASWCKPCREHNPELVAMSRNISSNQLQLIGISLDENKQSWINAIYKDKLNWVQLSDLKGFKGNAVKNFAVASIPYVLLIDQNSKILATTLDDAKKILNSK